MAFLDLFRKSGAKNPAAPAQSEGQNIPISDALTGFAMELSSKLPQCLPTEQDTWWFLAEQYDYSVDCGEKIQSLLSMSSLQMHQIEYEGRKSENSYVGKPNNGVAFLRNARQVLSAKFGGDLADLVITQGFLLFIEQNIIALNALRIKYAAHFQNNCVQDGAMRNAGRWQDVIDDIQGR